MLPSLMSIDIQSSIVVFQNFICSDCLFCCTSWPPCQGSSSACHKSNTTHWKHPAELGNMPYAYGIHPQCPVLMLFWKYAEKFLHLLNFFLFFSSNYFTFPLTSLLMVFTLGEPAKSEGPGTNGLHHTVQTLSYYTLTWRARPDKLSPLFWSRSGSLSRYKLRSVWINYHRINFLSNSMFMILLTFITWHMRKNIQTWYRRAERLTWSLYGCCLACGSPLPPPNFIGSQKFQNEDMFWTILSNFFWGDPPPAPHRKGNLT